MQVSSLGGENPLEKIRQPTPVFLPGKSHGQRSLVGYSPWDSPGQNTGVGSHWLLQGIFPTQGSNLGLLHCRQILYCLSHWGSPLQETFLICSEEIISVEGFHDLRGTTQDKAGFIRKFETSHVGGAKS